MDHDLSIIGVRQAAVTDGVFGISQRDRRHHVFVIGKTGSGKSTLLRNLLIQDLEAGRGLALLDPHGDLAAELLDHVPTWRDRHVVYFNPADLEYPVGFNILENVPADRRPLVAAGAVAAFKHIWAESWGPRLEYILYNAIAALLETPGATLLGVQRMLSDDAYRERITRRVSDPIVRRFWINEFARYDTRFRAEAIAPVQNKIGQFLANPMTRNIVGQTRSGFDIRFMMDNQRILIANLSKGRLGEEPSNLLGSLLVARFQLAALERADMPEHARSDFHLVVDEFQNFTSDSFAAILSEARKYGLCLTVANQYLAQLREPILRAVLGNVGSLITFRLGYDDASALAGEFDPFLAQTISDLARFETCVRVLRQGETTKPFLARTLKPLDSGRKRAPHLIQQSRMRFASRRAVIKRRVTRFLSAQSDESQ